MRLSLLIPTFLLALSTSVSAATLQYQFDVVGSHIGFRDLVNVTDPNDPPSQKEHAVKALHVLSEAIDRIGQITLNVTLSDRPHFECLAGFLCGDHGRFIAQHPSSLPAAVPGRPKDFKVVNGQEWYARFDGAGGGQLSFIDDEHFFVSGIINGDQFDAMSPYARFDLANVSITPIYPNPLPASAFLYAPLALPFLWHRRRRKQG